MKDIDELIATLEVVRDAVWQRNKEKAFEAITIFLLQFTEVCGQDATSEIFLYLEEIKDFIQSEDFDEANPAILAMLVWLTKTREKMQK